MPARIISELCNGCGQCAEVCPNNAITVTVKNAVVDQGKCNECEECVFTCMHGAIVIEEYLVGYGG